jgi:DNA-binding transcriptional LysR family regulator
MQAFDAAFPTVTLRLHVEALGAVIQLVHSGVAHIDVCGPPLHGSLPGLDRINVGGVELIPVAAPSHPSAAGSATAPGEARNHTQLYSPIARP